MDKNYVSVLEYVCKYIYLDSHTMYRETSCGSPTILCIVQLWCETGWHRPKSTVIPSK